MAGFLDTLGNAAKSVGNAAVGAYNAISNVGQSFAKKAEQVIEHPIQTGKALLKSAIVAPVANEAQIAKDYQTQIVPKIQNRTINPGDIINFSGDHPMSLSGALPIGSPLKIPLTVAEGLGGAVAKSFARAATSLALGPDIIHKNISIPDNGFTRSIFGEGYSGEGGAVLPLSEVMTRAAQGQGFAGKAAQFIQDKTGVQKGFAAVPIVGLMTLADLLPTGDNPLKALEATKSAGLLEHAAETFGPEVADVLMAMSRGEDLAAHAPTAVEKATAIVQDAVKLDPLAQIAKSTKTYNEFAGALDAAAKADPKIGAATVALRDGQTTFKDLKNFYEVSKVPKAADLGSSLVKATIESGGTAPRTGQVMNTSKEVWGISDEALTNLENAVQGSKKELEAVKGKVLSNAEVQMMAEHSNALQSVITRQETLAVEASVAQLKAETARMLETGQVTPQLIENLKKLNSFATDAARRLQSTQNVANTALGAGNAQYDILQQILKMSDNTEEILKAAKGVDFNDKQQVEALYRQFNPATWKQVLDEYRYVNLLSSPNTHIVNAFSNGIQTMFLKPITRLATGAIDAVASGLTGAERTAYMSEVPAYYKGMFNSTGDAFVSAWDVFRGKSFGGRLDLTKVPTGKLGPLTYVLNALEASDTFFSTLIKGGEKESLALRALKQGKTLDDLNLLNDASKEAQYWLFRQPLDPYNKAGQGYLLSTIDKATSAVKKLQEVPGVKWFIPFVQTPMNILKQGIEFSPLGFATMAGNTEKKVQFAKALIGSTVFAGAGYLVMNTETTWAAPSSAAEKNAFYAGKQPYSIRIGDKWYEYSRLGPLSYPIALAAAVKEKFQNDPSLKGSPIGDKLSAVVAAMGGFFAQQSYMEGLANLLDLVTGKNNYGKGIDLKSTVDTILTQFGRQLVPLSSLQAAVARTIDPIFRNPKTPVEQIMAGIPFLSKMVTPFKNPDGTPTARSLPILNFATPFKIKQADDQFNNDLLEAMPAQALWGRLKDIAKTDKNQANTLLKDIKKNHPALYTNLKKEKKWEDLGISQDDRNIAKLGVQDGARAQAMWDAIAKLKNAQQKNDFVKRMRDSGIMSDEVKKQLVKIKNSQGLPTIP